MTTASMQRLFDTASFRLPGATAPVMQYEFFVVLDEFFKGSNAWRDDIDFAVPGQQPAGTVYYITPAGPAIIDKLMWVYQTPQQNQLRGPQTPATMATPGEIVLQSQPSSDTTYRATVSLTIADPTDRDGNTRFPLWVLHKYRNVLLDGLWGRMMSMPAKPFTNNQLSVYHLRKFNAGVAAARVEAQRNNDYRSQAWRFPAFAGGSQTKGRGGFFPPQ
jgi:hypothetical protein